MGFPWTVREACQMVDLVILIIAVPLMAVIGLAFLGTAILITCRDVLGLDNKMTEWFDRQVGTGFGLGNSRVDSSLGPLLYVGLAILFAIFAYWFFQYGVVEPIAEYLRLSGFLQPSPTV